MGRTAPVTLTFSVKKIIMILLNASMSRQPPGQSILRRTPGGATGPAVVSLFALLLLVGLQAGCATQPPTASALNRLQGTWEGVAIGNKSREKITITIVGDSFHFHRDTNFWFETTIALPTGTNPQQLRATIRHSAPPETSNGKVVVAIFKIEDQTLTLAARGDGSEGTPTSFEAEEDQGLTRYELRKVQPPPKHSQPTKTKSP